LRTRKDAVDAHDVQEVYRANVSSIYAFFAYSVGPNVAEDLCATTFEHAIRGWSSFDPSRGTRRTWLFAIARNILTSHLRRESHRRGPSVDEFPAICESLVSTDDPLARLLTVEGVRERLSRLGETQRKVLGLRYGADLPTSEIARLLHTSEANVAQIASRALRQLRADEHDEQRANGAAANGSAAVARVSAHEILQMPLGGAHPRAGGSER
jgi:RNA polymerase sigma-70 factor (ECF subfamily)